MIGTICEVFQV